jgi:hypothetical protein
MARVIEVISEKDDTLLLLQDSHKNVYNRNICDVYVNGIVTHEEPL